MVKIGLREFKNEDIEKNFDSLAKAVVGKKPESVKGKYFLKSYIKTAKGSAIKVDMSNY